MHVYFFFFFNDTATTEIYTLSLHDALPISSMPRSRILVMKSKWSRLAFCTHSTSSKSSESQFVGVKRSWARPGAQTSTLRDRKSTRLNSSHANISYAVFCLKKKKHTKIYYR